MISSVLLLVAVIITAFIYYLFKEEEWIAGFVFVVMLLCFAGLTVSVFYAYHCTTTQQVQQ